THHRCAVKAHVKSDLIQQVVKQTVQLITEAAALVANHLLKNSFTCKRNMPSDVDIQIFKRHGEQETPLQSAKRSFVGLDVSVIANSFQTGFDLHIRLHLQRFENLRANS